MLIETLCLLAPCPAPRCKISCMGCCVRQQVSLLKKDSGKRAGWLHSEEAAPGLTLFNLMQCVLAIDCQCCVEDTGKLFIHSLSLKMLVLMRPDLVSWV